MRELFNVIADEMVDAHVKELIEADTKFAALQKEMGEKYDQLEAAILKRDDELSDQLAEYSVAEAEMRMEAYSLLYQAGLKDAVKLMKQLNMTEIFEK